MPNRIINPYQHNPNALAGTQQQLLPYAGDSADVNVVSGVPAGSNQLGVIPFKRSAKKFKVKGPTHSGLAFGDDFTDNVPAKAFAAGIALRVQGTGGAGGAANVAKKEDAPFSAIKSFQIKDRSGSPLMTVSGFEWYEASKHGGYQPHGDAKAAAGFSDVATGAGATGDFDFTLFWFFEFGREGRGCLPNDNASAAYEYTVVLGASGDVYSTAPATTIPSITVTLTLLARQKPLPTDPITSQPQMTSPPGEGIYQTWSRQSFTIGQGDVDAQISRVGNTWRGLILTLRSATDNTRATAETDGTVPTNITLHWDEATLLDNVPVAEIRDEYSRITGLAKEDGIIVIPFALTDSNELGGEEGDQYVPTALGANMTVSFNNGGPNASKLTAQVNDIKVPAGVNLYEVQELASSHPAVQQ